MRIFVAGASGVIGARLVPLLVAEGHEVVGMTRSPDKMDALRALGAEPVLCDVFDAAQLAAVVSDARPEVVMHQLTDLPDHADEIPAHAERNNRIRTEGTRNLIAAVQAAGATRLLAQSIAWTPPAGGEAVEEHERMVLDAGGVVLRYGRFYGPRTFGGDSPPPPPRIHVEVAAQRTAELLEAPGPSVVVITDTVG